MSTICRILILMISLGTALPASAVLVGTNDWIDPIETANRSWFEISQVCTFSSPSFGSSRCEGALGSVDLTGYFWATEMQVMDLFVEMGVPEPGYSRFDLRDGLWPASVFDVFGFTSTGNPADRGVPGLREVRGFTRTAELLSNGNVFAQIAQIVDGGLELDGAFSRAESERRGDRVRFASVGGWFFKPVATVVPEPSTLSVILLSLFGVGIARLRQVEA